MSLKSDAGRHAMSRRYLYVAYEDYPKVRALGATWDAAAKCWYIDTAYKQSSFRRWLGDARLGDARLGDARSRCYSIRSARAYVASAMIPCCRCEASTEVVCIYCQEGEVNREPQRAFSVSNITAIDVALKTQLLRWPLFSFEPEPTASFVNHCAHCGATQPEELLHDEPGAPFFGLCGPTERGLHYEPVVGCIRLTGDEGFAI